MEFETGEELVMLEIRKSFGSKLLKWLVKIIEPTS